MLARESGSAGQHVPLGGCGCDSLGIGSLSHAFSGPHIGVSVTRGHRVSVACVDRLRKKLRRDGAEPGAKVWPCTSHAGLAKKKKSLETMASSRALLIVAMLAAAACAANAACEPGDDFDRRTGKQCEQPQKRRRESVCRPHPSTTLHTACSATYSRSPACTGPSQLHTRLHARR